MATKCEPCYFLFHGVRDTFCRGTTIKKCPDPATSCPFYKSKAMQEQSLHRARLNFKKRYGYDGYGTFKYTENYTEDALNGKGLLDDDAGDSACSTPFLDRTFV